MNSEIKKLFKSFEENDFFEKIDLHIHSVFSDGIAEPETLVEYAEKKGFKYIAISDHNTVAAYLQTNILNFKIVIPAVEFDCWHKGVLVHILGYGIDVHNESLKPFYAKDKRGTEADIVRFFSYRNPKDVIQAIHSAGGIASLAHPACCWCFSLDLFVKSLIKFGLDGIETYYPYTRHRGIIKFHKTSTVKKLAEKYSLIKTGGTDNHSKNI